MYNMLRVKILYSTVLCDFFFIKKKFFLRRKKIIFIGQLKMNKIMYV